jgi:hypothetical protein
MHFCPKSTIIRHASRTLRLLLLMQACNAHLPYNLALLQSNGVFTVADNAAKASHGNQGVCATVDEQRPNTKGWIQKKRARTC